jgi:peptidoglycan-N-acetylglucosamine deacetylase
MKQLGINRTKSKLDTGLSLAAGVTALTAGMAGLVLYGVHGKSSQLFGPSVCRGRSSRRSIALTFDDGPSEGSLPVLEYLHSQQIRATFFQCGLNVLRHPDIARMISASGHEIGNHTYSHARLCPRLGWQVNWKSPAAVAEEFSLAQHIIRSEVGVRPKLLRAPYGLRWNGMRQIQRQLDLLGVMWTVIGHDWEWPAEQVAQHVIREASRGGIICLHDGRDIRPNPDISETLKAVHQIVPVLKDQGYSFDTVSELLN